MITAMGDLQLPGLDPVRQVAEQWNLHDQETD